MSKIPVAAEECTSLGASSRTFESYPNREVKLGPLPVARALPIKDRRMIGPWCFLDRFGPLTFSGEKPMDVAPHPHIGLQTVTWLLDGEVIHDDSLGSEAIARPGGVNVMTAGSGIAHAEQTPAANSGRLNGVQLWVALPDAQRNVDPSFAAIERVPAIEQPGGVIQVFAGSLAGGASPAPHYAEILGADITIHSGTTLEIGLNPGHEHAVLPLSGDCLLEDQPLAEKNLYYLGLRRSSAAFRSRAGGRILLIGGPPFPEPILMWWNFVGRSQEEIAQARADWVERRRFGDVKAYRGSRLDAPELLRFARPNPMS
jgi:redox-sensitive bicupin YhaK (pirin superfamily)